MAQARARSQKLAADAKARVQAQASQRQAAEEARLGESVAKAEAQIRAARDQAMSHVREIAVDTTRAIVAGQLGDDGPGGVDSDLANMAHRLVARGADLGFGLGDALAELGLLGRLACAGLGLHARLGVRRQLVGTGPGLGHLGLGRGSLGLRLLLQPARLVDVARDAAFALGYGSADPRHEHLGHQGEQHHEDDQEPDHLARPPGRIELRQPARAVRRVLGSGRGRGVRHGGLSRPSRTG